MLAAPAAVYRFAHILVHSINDFVFFICFVHTNSATTQSTLCKSSPVHPSSSSNSARVLSLYKISKYNEEEPGRYCQPTKRFQCFGRATRNWFSMAAPDDIDKCSLTIYGRGRPSRKCQVAVRSTSHMPSVLYKLCLP